jgi:hypothetical protein
MAIGKDMKHGRLIQCVFVFFLFTTPSDLIVLPYNLAAPPPFLSDSGRNLIGSMAAIFVDLWPP